MARRHDDRTRSAAGLSGPAVFVCLIALVGCTRGGDSGTRAEFDETWPRLEVAIREITLDLPVDPERAEFSGLDWWGDRLVLLPQYPEVFGGDRGGALPFIPRTRLEAYLSGADTTAIRPEWIVFDDGQLSKRVLGWDGYEAIAFDGELAYLTIECLTKGRWTGVLVRADVDDDPPYIVVDDVHRMEIQGASRRPNFTEEAVFVTEGAVGTIHELNGRFVNATPKVLRFTRDLRALEALRFPELEYRVTDASRIDTDGRLWVFNQFWPGEAGVLDARSDALAAVDRPTGRPVERLVPLRVTATGLVFDRDRPLVRLRTRADDVARNWEGVARWKDEGVLIVTDRHPRTIFAYVAWP